MSNSLSLILLSVFHLHHGLLIHFKKREIDKPVHDDEEHNKHGRLPIHGGEKCTDNGRHLPGKHGVGLPYNSKAHSQKGDGCVKGGSDHKRYKEHRI